MFYPTWLSFRRESVWGDIVPQKTALELWADVVESARYYDWPWEEWLAEVGVRDLLTGEPQPLTPAERKELEELDRLFLARTREDTNLSSCKAAGRQWWYKRSPRWVGPQYAS